MRRFAEGSAGVLLEVGVDAPGQGVQASVEPGPQLLDPAGESIAKLIDPAAKLISPAAKLIDPAAELE